MAARRLLGTSGHPNKCAKLEREPNCSVVLHLLYRKAFCLRAIEQDEAGQRDIYKINLLEAMLMAKRAWADVDATTIQNCWRHTGILPETKTNSTGTNTSSTDVSTPSSNPQDLPPKKNPKAWEVVRAFAMSDDIKLPQAEEQLQAVLGDRYVEAEWQPVLKVVMDAENDVAKALEGLDRLTITIMGCKISEISAASQPTQKHSSLLTPLAPHLKQLEKAERDLDRAVEDLSGRKRIIGTRLTLEEMLNPVEEKEVGESEYRFEGGDKEIVDQVRYEMAVKRGEIIEIEEEEEEEGDEDAEVGIVEVIQICERLERLSLRYGDPNTSLDLSRDLRHFRIHLRKEEAARAKQATLDKWFGKGQSQ